MSTNPLQQYFRKPSIYMRLPSQGKYYSDDVIDMSSPEIAVYPMTALDEFTSKTPDALFNGHAVINIIHSCVPAIKNAWEINQIDIDSILIAIKIASFGENLPVTIKCPSCSEESSYEISMLPFLEKETIPDYDSSLVFGDLSVKFRPLTYKETNENNLYQYELQKVLSMLDTYEESEEKKRIIQESLLKLNDSMFSILANTIESIATPEVIVTDKDHIREFLMNCDRNQSNAIKDKSTDLRKMNDIKPLKMRCMHCAFEFEYKVDFDMTSFFE